MWTTLHFCVLDSLKTAGGIFILSLSFEKLNSNPDTKLMSFIKHPRYNTDTKVNDVAVVLFEDLLTINEYVKPICPPPAKTSEWMNEGNV